MNPKISEYYNKEQAENYEKNRNKPIWHAEIDYFSHFKKKISKKYSSNLDILDIPSGTGRWIPYVYDIASNYIGVDVSSNMLEQAQIKINNLPNENKNKMNLIKTSIKNLPNHVEKKFELIIMTRFLPHFSEKEIKEIMIIMRKFLKGDFLISVRIANTKFEIFNEIFNLIFRSPLVALKRYFKSGRLTYTKLDIDYHKVFEELGYHVIEKNLVYKNKYSRYEYWLLN